MSEDKAIKVLQALGGSADIKTIREKARQMYPSMQLWRTIHNPLKKLVDKKQVTYRGKLRKGNSVWTLTKLLPEVKTADKLLKVDELKPETLYKLTPQEQEFQKLMKSVSRPAPPPVINNNSNSKPTLLEQTTPIIDQIGENLGKLEEENGNGNGDATLGTVASEIRKAIKKPYLDNLAILAQNVEKKEHKYRGRHDIIFEMLSYIKSKNNGKASVTEIMYKTLLSWYQLRKYILVLLKNELIEQDPYKDKVYQITEKGQHYSDTMDSIPINFD